MPLPVPASFALPSPVPANMESREAQEVIQRRWNRHDLASIAKIVGDDATVLVSPRYEPVDRTHYICWQDIMFALFPDIQMNTVRVLDGDGWASSEVVLGGTNNGSAIGMDATGKRIELRPGYLTRFDDYGLIISLKLLIDSMAILNQLGLEPVPAEQT